MYIKLRLLGICFLLSYISISYAEEAKQPLKAELRVLIDVSGSMKQNDPANLRIPALKLLVNLLPMDSVVGIWLFAENTIPLMDVGVVNEQWKKKALSQLTKIHSRGLFTNIEDAIQVSTQDWLKSTAKQTRNLILLTDGMVDVSKDIMLSAESRERVMMEQIPLLQQAGVKVQTVALSDNADAELLDKLAFDTNGWSETAKTAEQLQKVFFSLFKKAVPVDTVPIKGNSFSIDSSIKEFSVLIFKTVDADATQLLMPDKSKISNSVTKSGVSWLDEKNYDLVTVKNPVAGEWMIIAELDPDNQVMIVTDLKFNLDELPNYIASNETVDVSAFFTEKDNLISRKYFLSLINISIEQIDDKSVIIKNKMQASTDKPGMYRMKLGQKWHNGIYTIKFIVDGKTFKRQAEKTITVVESPITVEKEIDKAKRSVRIKLSANDALINAEMMNVKVMISQSGRATETLSLDKKAGFWEVLVELPEQVKSKTINFSIMAQTVKGAVIYPAVKPVVIKSALFIVDEPELTETKQKIEPEDKKTVLKDKEKPEIDEKKEPVNWLQTSAIVLGLNVILAVAGFFGYKWFKKRAAEKQNELLDRLA